MENTKVENVNVVEITETLTPKQLNKQLVEMGLWKSGCQFLSRDDKLKLMTASKTSQQKIYKKVKKVIERIRKSAANREYKYTFSEKSAANGVNVFGDINQLKEFITPVYEDKVYFSNGTDLLPAPRYKSIVTKDGRIVSVMNNSYKLIRNEDVVMPLLEKLDKLDNKWYIDKSHSFINDTKMRMQITFPELVFNDGKSDVAMSLFVANSYDGSSSLNVKWGAIREICSNGMVFGKMFDDFYQRHSSYFAADNLLEQIGDTFKLIPSISERVKLLEQTEFKMDDEALENVEGAMGKKAVAYVKQENDENDIKTQYDLLNVLTYFVSHYVNYKTREHYQKRISNMFEM